MTARDTRPLFSRKTDSQTEKAYGALEEMIVVGDLPPGTRWTETAIAQKIRIGRTPTRAALQKLAFQRLVRIAPREGVFISQIDYQGQLKIIQARKEIEDLIVSQAAQLASESERAELRKIVDGLSSIKTEGQMRTYMRLHFELTAQLGLASRNSYAAEFFAILQTLARRFLYFHRDRHPDLLKICDMHIQQVKAVVEGDSKRAQAATQARNDYAATFAREILMELIANSEVTIAPAGQKG